MSVWKDIRQKSLGKEIRIEDSISDFSSHVTHITFCGYVDAEYKLPYNAAIGSIYVIRGSNKLMLFNGHKWELITEMTEEENAQPITTLNSPIPIKEKPKVYIKTEENNYEAHFR